MTKQKTKHQKKKKKKTQRHDDKSMDRTRRALGPRLFCSRTGAALCTASPEAGAVRAQAPWDLRGRGRGGTEPHSSQAAKLRSVGGALGGLRSVAVHPQTWAGATQENRVSGEISVKGLGYILGSYDTK